MAKYPATSQGVEAVNKLASDLTKGSENLGAECKQLASNVAGRADGLGEYEAQIQEVIQEIAAQVGQTTEAIGELAAGLRTVAANLERLRVLTGAS